MSNHLEKLAHPSTCLLLPPLSSKPKFSNRSFRFSAPHLWDSLPPNVRTYAPVSDETTTHIINITRSSVSPTFKPLTLSRNYFLSHLPRSFPHNSLLDAFHFPFRLDSFNLSQTKFLSQLNTREYTITLGRRFCGAIENVHTYVLLTYVISIIIFILMQTACNYIQATSRLVN